VCFGVLTLVTTKIVVFWGVMLCSLADRCQTFGGTSCLHHQEKEPKDKGSWQESLFLMNIKFVYNCFHVLKNINFQTAKVTGLEI
jgi:hypothetical protein